MIIGNKSFNEGRTHIMGILNVTSDSFSDGGNFNTLDSALKHAEKMIKDGADVIDIGGESTRPNYTMISDEEEIKRICPVIEAIKNNFDIPISVDTYKSKVAEAALNSGADLINDIWGFKYDKNMASIVAKYNAACCLMHNRKNNYYENFMEEVLDDLKESIKIALDAGVDKNKIILDPGIGFAKTYKQNLEATRRCGELSKLGFPVLLGTSRKSMIGIALVLPVNNRLEGTLTTTVLAVCQNVLFVRVHDVLENKRTIDMTEKILGKA